MDYVRIVELSDDEVLRECGLRVGGGVNTWGEKITPMLIARGMDPDILYPGSLEIHYRRNSTDNGMIFEDARYIQPFEGHTVLTEPAIRIERHG